MTRRLTKWIVAVAFLASMVVVIAPAPTSARCVGWKTGQANGYGNYGDETANGSATCDADKYYAGRVAENPWSQGDGHCAVVRGKGTGGSWAWLGYSCANNNAFKSYGWNVGSTSGRLKMCHGWNANDCHTGYDSWSM